MNESIPDSKPEPTPAEKFRGAMKQILSVPKAEIDRREEEYQKRRATERRETKAQD